MDEQARLQEIRARARELDKGSEERTARPESTRTPAVQTWRPVVRSNEPRDASRYQHGSGFAGYPGSAGYPYYLGAADPPGYPSMMGGRGVERERRWQPPARVLHREGALVIRFELPGIDRKDVEVHVEGRKLVVEGERADDRPAESGPWRSDWGYGPFRREVELPRPVDPSDVHARYRNGVLDVAVPELRPEERRRAVKVDAA